MKQESVARLLDDSKVIAVHSGLHQKYSDYIKKASRRLFEAGKYDIFLIK